MAVASVAKYRQESEKQLKSLRGALVPRISVTEHYQILVDDPATTHAAIYTALAALTPAVRLYAPHSEFPGAIVKNIGSPQGDDDDVYTYDVAVKYDDDFDVEDTDEPDDDNPMNKPVVIQGGFNEVEMIAAFDANGDPIRNSAKDPFDPPITKKAGGARFTMTKNLPSLSYGFLRTYKNAINSDGWLGFPAYTVRIANISFSRQVESKADNSGVWVYWPHTFEFELAEPDVGTGTWRVRVLDRGFRKLSGGVQVQIKDDTGQPVQEPKNLNGSGVPYADQSSTNWLTFEIYRELPFAALGLP